MRGWNGKKRDHLWISVHFHPHIFILLDFNLDIRNGPSNFGINFSRSGFFKFLLKDESVRMKWCISTIWSYDISSYDISSWKLIGLIPHSYIILTNQDQECIFFIYGSVFKQLKSAANSNSLFLITSDNFVVIRIAISVIVSR